MKSHESSKFLKAYPPLTNPVVGTSVGAFIPSTTAPGTLLFTIDASTADPCWVEFQAVPTIAVAGSSPVVGLGSAGDDSAYLPITNTLNVTSTSLRYFTAKTNVYWALTGGTTNAGQLAITATIKA